MQVFPILASKCLQINAWEMICLNVPRTNADGSLGTRQI